MAHPAPLSHAQLRMWLFAQLEPASPLYHQVRVIRWSGPLDVSALERALSELLRRHEVLRAQVWLEEGGAFQRAGEATPLTMPVEDLAWSPPETREGAAARRARSVAQQPFDLRQGPLVRAVLLRLGPTEHHLVLVIHHIASDEWSARLLIQELCKLYSAYVAGNPPLLPHPTRQFAEYVVRQQKRLQTPEEEEDLAYWRERLQGAPPLLQLPTDRPRPAQASYEGGEVCFRLPAATLERLAALGRRERVTLFMTLFAAFQAVLCRWSSQTDLLVGVPIAGRTQLDLEEVVGCFANTLVLRTDLAGDPSFRDLLRRIRGVVIDGLAHQELPFERLVQELRPVRSVNYHPLFQVLFNVRDFPPLNLTSPGMEIELLPTDDRGRAFVDLAMELDRARDGYAGVFAFNANLFDRPTVERLAAEYLAGLDTVLDDPDVRLGHLPGLSGGRHESEDEATTRALAVLERLSDDDVRRLLAHNAGDPPT
jgi:hypothetical protein